jgi:alanine racemase
MKRDGYIAVVPVGYFDGLSRKHSNNGVAIIDGVRCPLVGKVYMNFSSYDITDHPNLSQIASEHQVILTGLS